MIKPIVTALLSTVVVALTAGCHASTVKRIPGGYFSEGPVWVAVIEENAPSPYSTPPCLTITCGAEGKLVVNIEQSVEVVARHEFRVAQGTYRVWVGRGPGSAIRAGACVVSAQIGDEEWSQSISLR